MTTGLDSVSLRCKFPAACRLSIKVTSSETDSCSSSSPFLTMILEWRVDTALLD